MNWTVDYKTKEKIVVVKTFGDFNLDDYGWMVRDILARDFWQPGMNVFFDHRALQFVYTDVELMRRATENHKENDALIGDGKAAILMKSLVDYGRGRQYELLSAGQISAKLKIFMDEKAALDWLLEENDEKADE